MKPGITKSSPEPSSDGRRNLQSAKIDLSVGPVRLRAHVRLTPAGLLAIGALVSSVLVASSAIVWSATSVARRHPLARRLGRR